MFACQFGRYRYKRLPFGAAPAGDMFKRKLDKTYKELPNVYSIAHYILVVRYRVNGKDHDETLQRVLQIYRQIVLKLNKVVISDVHQSDSLGKSYHDME